MTRFACCLVLLVLAGCHAPSHAAGHHRFDKANEWAPRFEDPSRDAWQKPEEVLAALSLPPDARAADLGSATGYFAVRLARALPQGKVYGVDVEADMTRYLAERARREGLPQLVSVQGTETDARLPEPIDLILVVDTYHHISDRPAYFRRLREKLKRGGRLAVIDFRKGAPFGPPDAHKLSPEQMTRELAEAGFREAASHDFLPHQHFLVYQAGAD